MSETPPGFVEQHLFLPQRLWERVAELCESSDKEPSEVVADALRMLLAGGHPAASPQPIPRAAEPADDTRGDATGAESEPVIEPVVDAAAAQQVFAQIRDQPMDSDALRQGLLNVVRGVEQRDQDGHGEAVAAMARALAETIGLADDEACAIELAALTHDLGKSRVPAEILGKQGRLTPEEWRLVRRYPEFSAEMVGQCTQLEQVATMVRHHQERWNGTGYPDALEGDAIPVGAQIVGLCDVFHVLTSERAYRPALSPDMARKTVDGGRGRLWNPDLAEVFLSKVVKRESGR